MKKRFTGPQALLREAEEYAKCDNRTFSEFVCEALRQHMRRYPKILKERPADSLAGRVAKLEEMMRQGYPQVPSNQPRGEG
jgi:hypothetical protein